MKASDINYTYTHHGYTMLYKGKPIGGAGTRQYGYSGPPPRLPSNLKFNREQAQVTKRKLLDGHIPKYMQIVIDRIDRETKKTTTSTATKP